MQTELQQRIKKDIPLTPPPLSNKFTKTEHLMKNRYEEELKYLKQN